MFKISNLLLTKKESMTLNNTTQVFNVYHTSISYL